AVMRQKRSAKCSRVYPLLIDNCSWQSSLTVQISFLIVSSHIYFPTTSNGLKEIGNFLGVHWTNRGASGLDSVVWREEWEDGGEEVLKAKLLEYNRDDCLALRAVTKFIASITIREAEWQ